MNMDGVICRGREGRRQLKFHRRKYTVRAILLTWTINQRGGENWGAVSCEGESDDFGQGGIFS